MSVCVCVYSPYSPWWHWCCPLTWHHPHLHSCLHHSLHTSPRCPRSCDIPLSCPRPSVGPPLARPRGGQSPLVVVVNPHLHPVMHTYTFKYTTHRAHTITICRAKIIMSFISYVVSEIVTWSLSNSYSLELWGCISVASPSPDWRASALQGGKV